MRISDFEKMQQNLEQMRQNLNNIQNIEHMKQVESTKKTRRTHRGRRAVEKKINKIEHPKMARIEKDEHIIVMITIAIVAITFVFSTSIFAKTMSDNTQNEQATVEKQEENTNQSNEDNQVVEETVEEVADEEIVEEESLEDVVIESNENAIELENILMENVSVLKSKEYAEEVRPLEFETQYIENANLPEGEEVITQEGVNGKQQVTVIKSYENNELVAENILEAVPMESAIPQKVDVGTSKFLANNKVHLGDTMYVTEEVALKDDSDSSSNEVCTILKSLDVKLEELAGEEWCKIKFDGKEGFVQSKYLTSKTVTPGIVDANRIQRIKMNLSEDMPLNKSTGFTLEDYKKMLSGISSDKNKVIEENAETFYNIDKNYNINGVFVAAMAIHESGWATSTISKDKKNLFGYGAYDSSPYQSSYSFDTYAEGIELVAKVLVKYYINEEGTPIYDGETAKGSYYNGSTAADVNIKYASDSNWHSKVFKYMEMLYGRI